MCWLDLYVGSSDRQPQPHVTRVFSRSGISRPSSHLPTCLTKPRLGQKQSWYSLWEGKGICRSLLQREILSRLNTGIHTWLLSTFSISAPNLSRLKGG